MLFSIYNISMNQLVLPIILALLASASATHCGHGGVLCPSGKCHFPNYIEGCSIYSSQISCYQCQFNYVKDGNICRYAPPADNSGCCSAYSQQTGKCVECAPGMTLIDGSCKEIKIIGCIQKTSSGSCTNCAIGYTLFGGRCLRTIQGCQNYHATGQCDKCHSNFELYYGACVPIDIQFTQCLFPFVKLNNGQCAVPGCDIVYEYGCAECLAGYKLLPTGACESSGIIVGCQRYRRDGYCHSCSTLFQLKNGYCIPRNCELSTENGECKQCYEGFSLTNEGICVIPNCLVSNSRECVLCEKGYVEVRGLCKKDSPRKVCTVCALGYYLGKDGECHPYQTGCLSYSRGVCEQCENHLYLTKNYECAIKEPGCIYRYGVCSECYSPFELTKNNKCVIEGCEQYENGRCSYCYDPYILTEIGSCTYENCYEVRNQRCVKCFDGYDIQENGFCYVVDPYCRAYDFKGICIECKKGYYKSGQSCIQEKFGCNYVDGRCVSCRAPFEYNPVSQSCEIDGCLQYFLGGCKDCAAGYDLRYNSCRLPHCLISHKGHCRECNPDYILRSDGKCVNKDEFCWKYDDDGYCIECAPKYFLSKKTNKCQLREPGCHYNDDDKCYRCDKPFFFDGIRCEIYGCLQLNWKGCEQCFYPMQVNQYGLCQVPNCDRMDEDHCVVCKPGFFIAEDGSCKQEDPKCLVYSSHHCQKCVKGYRLDRNRICQYADEHCWDFTESGHCTNCDRLYFLNQHKKCQIKDRFCEAYSNGRCIECKDYYYLHRGLCYPNAKGCLVQKNIRNCLECEQGYKLQFGTCTVEITKLSWNSIDMDFWGGESDWEVEKSQQTFTVGKNHKLNLEPAITEGKGKVFFSSCRKGNRVFQVDDYRFDDGWQCEIGRQQGEYLGVELGRLQTFYALDIKVLGNNKMHKFAIEYSEDGQYFRQVGQYSLKYKEAGIVETIYFTPVYAQSIRIVVLSGAPNIKFEFYYSNGESSDYHSDTYISQTTQETIQDQLVNNIFAVGDSCVDKELCWMGIQLCEPKEITGFSLKPDGKSDGIIEAVYLKYSKDGVQFECYDSCREIVLVNSQYHLDPYAYGIKLRVFPTKWTGSPSYSVAFTYNH